jgi:hypothetical protein
MPDILGIDCLAKAKEIGREKGVKLLLNRGTIY